MKRLLAILCLICAAMPCMPLQAQIVNLTETARINTDSVRRAFDSGPYFGLYKDNYFIFGTALGERPSKENSNVKFQISIAQRLTKSVLPWHSYLYLFYSQKCFWNILEDSMPMTDLNFNPGIGLAKPLFVKNQYIGKVFLILEHESNGRDGDASRSWNKVSVGGNIIVDKTLAVHGKFWIPIVDGQNNRDILQYCGIFQTGVQATTPSGRYGGSIILTTRTGGWFRYNTTVELYARLFKRDNQFLFLQYYNGYGEGLLAYKQFHSEIRVGICIKPKLFSDY